MMMRAALLLLRSQPWLSCWQAKVSRSHRRRQSRGRRKPLAVVVSSSGSNHQRIFLDRRGVAAAAGWSSTTRNAALSSEDTGGSQQPQQEDSSSSSPLDRPVLAALDAAALTTFAAVGKASHSAADGSLDIVAVAVTAAPFLLAWFATSPLTGVYNKQDTAAAAVVLPTWRWLRSGPPPGDGRWPCPWGASCAGSSRDTRRPCLLSWSLWWPRL